MTNKIRRCIDMALRDIGLIGCLFLFEGWSLLALIEEFSEGLVQFFRVPTTKN